MTAVFQLKLKVSLDLAEHFRVRDPIPVMLSHILV